MSDDLPTRRIQKDTATAYAAPYMVARRNMIQISQTSRKIVLNVDYGIIWTVAGSPDQARTNCEQSLATKYTSDEWDAPSIGVPQPVPDEMVPFVRSKGQ